MIEQGSWVRVVRGETNHNGIMGGNRSRHIAVGKTGYIHHFYEDRVGEDGWAYCVYFDDPAVDQESLVHGRWLFRGSQLEEVTEDAAT